MANCKDCVDYDFCKASDPSEGIYPEDVNDVETKCDGFEAKEENMKQVYGHPPRCDVAPSDEWLKEKEIEETTLRIKAAGYDVIKDAMLEQMKMDYDISDTFNIIDGVIRMEEAVTAAFIK